MPFSKARQTNFNALRKLNLQDRIDAVADPKMGQFLISMLSPTQAAELFPKYYIERNQNISGFLKAIPSSLSAAKQKEYEQQLENTASGESAGANYNAGGYRKKWQENVDAQKAIISKKGVTPPPQLSPEQKAAFDALKAGDIDINDERMKWLKNAPKEVLGEVGISIVKDDKGAEKFHYAAPKVSEEDARKSMMSSASGNQLAVELIKRKEGFLTTPRFDVNHLRAGYGSDTVTLPDGTVKEITAGMKVSREDAERDLLRRIPEFQRNGIIKYVGQESWNRLNDQTKAALTSLAYNYGSIGNLGRLQQAIKTGNKNEIAAAVASYSSHNNRKNYDRRMEESRMIANSSGSNTSYDPITQNYTPQQIAARQEQLKVEMEAGRLGKLASITQSQGQPQPASEAGSSTLAQRYAGKAFANAKGKTECAAFAQQAGHVGHTSGWSPGNAASAGNLKPGDWIATFNGGKYTNRYGESHTAMFNGYQRDQSGKIVGIKVLEQFNKIGAVREHTYPLTGAGGEKDAGSYYQIVDRGKPATMAETVEQAPPAPAAPPKKDDTDQIRPTGQTETVRDKTVESRAADPKTASTDIKPLETVTQPQGPLNTPKAETSSTPAPAPSAAAPVAPAPSAAEPAAPAAAPEEPTATVQKSVEQPKPAESSPERYKVDIPKFINAIKQTSDFKSNPLSWMATDSMITSGFNDDARVKAAGVRLDEKGVMHFTKGMTPEAKEAMATFDTKSFMTKIEDKKKEDTPTQVKPKAKGGTTKVSTEEIAAYPIGGLQGDNAVVVNAQQQPLFTMNTNEAAVMNPDTKTVDVIPNQKGKQVGPQQQSDNTPVMNEFTSAIQELQKNFDDLSTKSGKMPELNLSIPEQYNQSWLKELGHVTEIPYRNPTAHRVASRAHGVETGTADNGYHFSHGNKS